MRERKTRDFTQVKGIKSDKIAKMRERKTSDFTQVKCIKSEDFKILVKYIEIKERDIRRGELRNRRI